MEGSAARARALGQCTHVPNRPSATTSTEGKTTLHRVDARSAGTVPGILVVPLHEQIACSFTLARQTTFRNEIPAGWCPAACDEAVLSVPRGQYWKFIGPQITLFAA